MITLILPFHGFMKSRIRVSLFYPIVWYLLLRLLSSIYINQIGGYYEFKRSIKRRYESSYEGS